MATCSAAASIPNSSAHSWVDLTFIRSEPDMEPIHDIELLSRSEYFAAEYVDPTGKAYDIVITRHVEMNIGWEGMELASIQFHGDNIDDETLWKEVEQQLQTIHLENPKAMDSVCFTVEIGREYLDTLDHLVQLVLADAPYSPEEALEASLFTQIKRQRTAGVFT